MRLPFSRKRADHGQAVALGQHAIDHEHVVVAAIGHRQALLAIAGEIGDMADFTKRLDQIVGGLAVVFDDQQAHLRGSCGHGNVLSLTMARPPCTCKATGSSLDEVKKAGGEAGGPHRP